jgi:hypothetical protein
MSAKLEQYSKAEIAIRKVFQKNKKDLLEQVAKVASIIRENISDLKDMDELTDEAKEVFKDELEELLGKIDSEKYGNIFADTQSGDNKVLQKKINTMIKTVHHIEEELQSILSKISHYSSSQIGRNETYTEGKGLEEGHKAIIKEIRDLKVLLKKHAKNMEGKKGGTLVSHQEGMDGGSVPQRRLKGEGVVSSITNLGKKAYRKTKETASKIASTAKDVATKVITGNTGMPPNVKTMLDKYGDSIITDMTIARNPVGSALVSALSVASMGEFKKNLDNSPYDKLFHLKLIITLHNGIKLALEKVERVSLTKYTKPVKGQEDENVAVDKQITLGQLYHNAEMAMGDRFYPYSARDNNCQSFVLSVLKASGIGGERDFAFIKQDTKSLFGDESFLRKLSNTVTDVGARFNVLMQGGKVDLKNLRQRKGKGVRKVYPPDHQDKDFISLPNYLQNDVLAGNVVLPDDTKDDDGEGFRPLTTLGVESGTGLSFRKSFYQRQAKYKHIKSLDAYARYIVSHPSDFSMKVRKRAQFLINVH